MASDKSGTGQTTFIDQKDVNNLHVYRYEDCIGKDGNYKPEKE